VRRLGPGRVSENECVDAFEHSGTSTDLQNYDTPGLHPIRCENSAEDGMSEKWECRRLREGLCFGNLGPIRGPIPQARTRAISTDNRVLLNSAFAARRLMRCTSSAPVGAVRRPEITRPPRARPRVARQPIGGLRDMLLNRRGRLITES
jgi:hypothetical protein